MSTDTCPHCGHQKPPDFTVGVRLVRPPRGFRGTSDAQELASLIMTPNRWHETKIWVRGSPTELDALEAALRPLTFSEAPDDDG